MAIAAYIRDSMEKASWIRRMFEEGIKLRQQFGADNVFDFTLGNPDVEPPPEFHAALTRLVQEDAKGSHGYMSNAGYADVRETIAKKTCREQGVSIDGSHVIMTVGAAGGLNVLFKTILNPGDEVVVIKPYFAEYAFYIANHQGRMVLAEAKSDFSLDPEAVAAVLTPKTAAVLINSPNNPTGRIYSEESLKALTAALSAHANKCGRAPYLIADEPYREIVYGGRRVPPVLGLYPETIVVTSYSKSLSLPGERIGYIALGPGCSDVESLMAGLILSNRILGFVNAPALMQRAVAQLTEARVDVTPYQRRCSMLAAGLRQAGIEFVEPEGAFYIFCKAPTEEDVAFILFLKKYNVLVVPGSGFGVPGWFRMSYCVPESTITGAIPKLCGAMADWRRQAA
jgi:aspartate aminotransferase